MSDGQQTGDMSYKRSYENDFTKGDAATVRKIWAANSMADGRAVSSTRSPRPSNILRLANGAVEISGNEEIVLRDHPEFMDISPVEDLHIYSLVKFPQRFLCPPSVILSFGSPHKMFMIGAEDITCESFTIEIRSGAEKPVMVSVFWKAAGFVTFDVSAKSRGWKK
ncbi:hypothetical protein [Pseudodonghicola sp.]|uniref:hypothetical protein n=1 Tax=Pseudodonghicola sp. TaxID=1969463 RepID=UPI003A96A74F